MLGHGGFKRRGILRRIASQRIAGGCAAVIPRNRQSGSRDKTLVVGKVVFPCIGGGGRAENAGLLGSASFLLNRSRNRGVEVLGRRSRAAGCQRQARTARTRAARTAGSAARTAARAAGGRSAGQGVGHNAGGHAQRRLPGIGAQNIGIGDVEIVARDGDVVIILNRQCNGVGKAQVDFAVLQQVAQAHGIDEAGLVDRRRPVDVDRIAQPTAEGLGEIPVRCPQ